jgi:hypothetical protein
VRAAREEIEIFCLFMKRANVESLTAHPAKTLNALGATEIYTGYPRNVKRTRR